MIEREHIHGDVLGGAGASAGPKWARSLWAWGQAGGAIVGKASAENAIPPVIDRAINRAATRISSSPKGLTTPLCKGVRQADLFLRRLNAHLVNLFAREKIVN
jgi:hypothetical protein